MSRTSSEDENSTFLDHYSHKPKNHLPAFALDNANDPNSNSRRTRNFHLAVVVLLSAVSSILATLAMQYISTRLFHQNGNNSWSSLPDLSVPASKSYQ